MNGTEDAGTQLVNKIDEYLGRNPGMAYADAMHAVVRDPANRSLAAEWGGYSAPTRIAGDPGQIIADRADELAQRECISFSEATRRVMAAADPGLVRAYHAGGDAHRHYSELPPAQRSLRRLAPGEAIDPARTYVMKMATPDVGGGRFELVAA